MDANLGQIDLFLFLGPVLCGGGVVLFGREEGILAAAATGLLQKEERQK